MKKKILATSLICLMSAMLFAGCGKTAEKTAEKTDISLKDKLVNVEEKSDVEEVDSEEVDSEEVDSEEVDSEKNKNSESKKKDDEPDFSYKDTTFIIDGYEIDITPFAPAATAIMDAKRVGDWIILDCHVNPNIGTYLFYNIPDGLIDYFEYQIDGANLIWQGDDLSTAVYQQYNDIYDIWGHHIGHIQDGELYELSFKDKNTIAAKCWIVDAIGREKEYTEEFEYDPCDGAVWAYFEYMLGGNVQWRRLKEMAGDAMALIIVDPPEKICDKMSAPVTIENGALDKVAVVPLFDDSEVSIRSDKEEVDRGRAAVFEVTVPEGMPIDTITVEAPGHEKAEWEVWQLSGKTPQMSTFIQ